MKNFSLKFATMITLLGLWGISALAKEPRKELLACAGQESAIAQDPLVLIKIDSNNHLFINAGWPGLDEAATSDKDANGVITFSPVNHEGSYSELSVDLAHQYTGNIQGVAVQLAAGILRHCDGSVLQDGKCMLGSYDRKVVCAVY